MSQASTTIERYRKYMSPHDTARTMGVSMTEVYRTLSKMNHRGPIEIPREKLIKLLGRFALGVSTTEIGKSLNITTKTVYNYSIRYGLNRNTKTPRVAKEERIWSAVLDAMDYTDFRVNYATAYNYARELNILNEVKQKFLED